MSAALRAGLSALALGLAGVLAAAGVATVRAAGPHGHWSAGLRRLVVLGVWERFDRWAWAALALAVVVALVRLRWPRPAGGIARGAVALLALIAMVRLAGAVDAWRAGHGPNLVLVSIDTLRADRLGAYGCPLPTSPTLDRRLAGEGVVFERVWSQSPKTTPSHMTMFTSLYPSVHGVQLWDGRAPGRALSPAVHTLAEVLRNAGYATAAFTGGAHMERVWGFAQGFDVYEESNGAELGAARRWLRRNRGRKLFLFFHTYQVHDPYLPPLATADLFAPGYRGPLRDVVKRLRNDPTAWEEQHRLFWAAVDRDDPGAVEFLARLYDAGIRHMDETTLAPLLDDLATYGLEQDTLVVFTSDHGEAFLEHGIFLHDDLHAETLHVPLVLRFPGRLPRGRRVATPVRLVDLMPTVLELLGVPVPPEAQGRTRADLARGRAEATPPDDAVSEFSSPARGRRYESLRQDGRTYIVDGSAEALFEDAGERADRAAERPAVVAAMRAALAGWRAACEALAARLGPRGDAVEPRDENVRRLRALGYVE